MSRVIDLHNYKIKGRASYLAKYGSKLDIFIEDFIKEHFSQSSEMGKELSIFTEIQKMKGKKRNLVELALANAKLKFM